MCARHTRHVRRGRAPRRFRDPDPSRAALDGRELGALSPCAAALDRHGPSRPCARAPSLRRFRSVPRWRFPTEPLPSLLLSVLTICQCIHRALSVSTICQCMHRALSVLTICQCMHRALHASLPVQLTEQPLYAPRSAQCAEEPVQPCKILHPQWGFEGVVLIFNRVENLPPRITHTASVTPFCGSGPPTSRQKSDSRLYL